VEKRKKQPRAVKAGWYLKSVPRFSLRPSIGFRPVFDFVVLLHHHRQRALYGTKGNLPAALPSLHQCRVFDGPDHPRATLSTWNDGSFALIVGCERLPLLQLRRRQQSCRASPATLTTETTFTTTSATRPRSSSAKSRPRHSIATFNRNSRVPPLPRGASPPRAFVA
jgi:hypothetical protein